MKYTISYHAVLLLFFAATRLVAYNFDFRNLTNRDVVIEMTLAGGVDEKSEQITVPAWSGGEAVKSYGGLRIGLCLSVGSIKMAYKGAELKPAVVQVIPGALLRSAQQTFDSLLEEPGRLMVTMDRLLEPS